MKKIDRRLAGAAFGVMTLALGAGFAYFSDYSTNNAGGIAGTLGVESVMTKNQEDLDNLNPGDETKLGFNIKAIGNKMMQVRETFVLRVEVPVYKTNEDGSVVLDKDGQPVVDKYKEATLSPDFASEFEITDKDGKEIGTRTVKGGKITYVLNNNTYVLDGKKELANRETAVGEGIEVKGNVVGDDNVKTEYILKFKPGAGNEWQAAKVHIDYLVEGAQYLNNKTPDWKKLHNEEIDFGGDPNHSVVNQWFKRPTHMGVEIKPEDQPVHSYDTEL